MKAQNRWHTKKESISKFSQTRTGTDRSKGRSDFCGKRERGRVQNMTSAPRKKQHAARASFPRPRVITPLSVLMTGARVWPLGSKATRAGVRPLCHGWQARAHHPPPAQRTIMQSSRPHLHSIFQLSREGMKPASSPHIYACGLSNDHWLRMHATQVRGRRKGDFCNPRPCPSCVCVSLCVCVVCSLRCGLRVSGLESGERERGVSDREVVEATDLHFQMRSRVSRLEARDWDRPRLDPIPVEL